MDNDELNELRMEARLDRQKWQARQTPYWERSTAQEKLLEEDKDEQ